ncbi:protocadherin-10-like [Heptranchias perlo]|uniref:protocadherin-10-like n=1 Tax=Heptranchias perlo TaxID=212740 RepID=UPI00355A9546
MANVLRTAASFIFLLCVSDLVSGQIRYSIPEELEYGAFIGNIAEDLRLNVWELSARKFRMVSDDRKQYMEVNLENGILFINERIDREQICGQIPTCSLSFQIALDNPLAMHRVAVEIIDVNDNSPSFPKSEFSLQISELIAPGARFPLESAHDPDVGTNTISSYQISPNEHFGLNLQTRSDGNIIAEISIEKPLDREEQPTFHLVLTAFDGGIPRKTGTAQILITIMDANDNAPVFDHQIYKTSVLENAPKGWLVIRVNAADLDEGTNAELAYSFTSHTSQRARELFRLEAVTGEIRVQGVLDFEEANIYDLGIEAMDKGWSAMTGHAKVMVRLIDVNDNVPEVELTSISSTVPENAQPGTMIAAIGVRDADSGENGQVHCKVDLNIPFKLRKSLSNNYELVTNDTLDRETTPLYNISISAWDRGSPPLATIKNILVSVSDVNDIAPRFTQPSYNVFLMENNRPGASIFAVTALDLDLDQNGEVSYSMLENHMQYMPASSYITINSKSGNIYARRSFDYEQLKNFQIKVQAQDAGSPPLSSTAIVNVIILDQNDNAPIVVSPSAWNISSAMVILRQLLYPGYLITKVIATDADSGQNARLSYQMLQATDPGLFSLGLLSGEIRTVRSYKDQDATTQRVVIMVKDNGQPSLTSTATIFFSVLSNVTEKLSVLNQQSRNSKQFSNWNVYLIIIFGSTSFIFFATIIFLVVLNCKQDRNTNHYNPTSCCGCRRRHSNDASNRRAAPKGIFNYTGAGETLPISERYHYAVCLSPESSKSDFLFLKPCEATLPLNDLNVRDTSVRI